MSSTAVQAVFHMRTPLAAGTDELLPVDALREIDPEAYARAIAKYDDTPERRRLRDTAIPGTGRSWTQVVFLSPIHPHAIWDTWRSITGKELPPMEFWQIPVRSLPEGCVVFDRQVSVTGEAIDPSEVVALDVEQFTTAVETTPENRDWLEDLAARGHRGALFNKTPHVLSPEPVRLERAQVIDWEQTPVG